MARQEHEPSLVRSNEEGSHVNVNTPAAGQIQAKPTPKRKSKKKKSLQQQPQQLATPEQTHDEDDDRKSQVAGAKLEDIIPESQQIELQKQQQHDLHLPEQSQPQPSRQSSHRHHSRDRNHHGEPQESDMESLGRSDHGAAKGGRRQRQRNKHQPTTSINGAALQDDTTEHRSGLETVHDARQTTPADRGESKEGKSKHERKTKLKTMSDKGERDGEQVRVRLEMDLDLDVHIKGTIRGDVTLALLK